MGKVKGLLDPAGVSTPRGRRTDLIEVHEPGGGHHVCGHNGVADPGRVAHRVYNTPDGRQRRYAVPDPNFVLKDLVVIQGNVMIAADLAVGSEPKSDWQNRRAVSGEPVEEACPVQPTTGPAGDGATGRQPDRLFHDPLFGKVPCCVRWDIPTL